MNETQNTNVDRTTTIYPGGQPPAENIQTVGNTNPPEKPKSKKGLIIAGVILLIIVLVGGIAAYLKHKENVKREEARLQRIAQQEAEKAEIETYNSFINDLNLLYSTSYSGASQAESVCVLVLNVWKDSIFNTPSAETEKYVSGAADFNEAIQRVYADAEIQEQIVSIKGSKDKVNTYIQNLQSCPAELSKAYDIALDLNAAFNALTDLALSPEGSYTSFGTAKNDKTDAYIAAYKTMEAVIPGKKIVPLYDKNGSPITDLFDFDIYLNQSGDKLPNTVDDKLATIGGLYKDVATICGTEGELAYNVMDGLVYHISWEVENPKETLPDAVLKSLREKYGKEDAQKDNSYSWNKDSTCMVLLDLKDDKTRISWLSAP